MPAHTASGRQGLPFGVVVILLVGAAGLAGLGVASSQNQRVSSSDASATIRGKVVDAHGPVAEARVGVKGDLRRVHTDEAGVFELPAHPSSEVRLVASKPGYYISGGDLPESGPATIRLEPHPADDCPSYRWVASDPNPAEPEQCGNCHEAIFREWSEGGHAFSAVNRRFMNLYEGTDWHGNEEIGWSLLAECPEGSGVCYSCHVPSLEPDPRVISDLRRVGGVHRQGVHCDFCHKIADVRTDQVGLDHGRFAMRLLRPPPGEQLFLGPLDDEDRSHSVYSPLYRQSRYCASCHEGILFGTHAYSEYSEWLSSPYAERGVECQDCHMAPTGKMTNLAPGHGGVPRDPQTLAGHGSLRGKPEGLRRYLSLSVDAQIEDGQVEVVTEAEIRDIGHRFPTGYPGRQLILWVRATDADGRPLELLAGPVLPPLAGEGPVEEGGLAGQPGRMYAKQLEGLDGAAPVPYWRPNRVAADTRLLPDATDRARFRFSRPQGEVTVVARLLYRRFSKRLADEKGWPDNEFVVATRKWFSSKD